MGVVGSDGPAGDARALMTAAIVQLPTSRGLAVGGRHGPAEARARQAPAQQVEIQLGHRCNNRCTFCVSGQRTQRWMAEPFAHDGIEAALSEAAGRGVRAVTILGGEPTIDLRFFDILRRCRELGFEDITIFTNGVRGDEPKFLQRVLDLGSFSWRFSVQGGTAEVHDAVVGRLGAFARIEAGLAFLHERGQRLSVNTCVTEQSHLSLPRIPSLLARHGVGEYHLDLVRPESAGERSEAWILSILPRFRALASSVSEMLRRFDAEAPGVLVHVGNLPFCLLPGEGRIHHGGTHTVTVTSGTDGGLEHRWDKYEAQREGMVHGPACGACVRRAACRGVPEVYARRWGWDEFVPIVEPAPAPAALSGAPSRALLITLARLTRGWAPPAPYGAPRWREVGGDFELRFPAPGGAADLRLAAEGEGVVLRWAAGGEPAYVRPLVQAVSARLGLRS